MIFKFKFQLRSNSNLCCLGDHLAFRCDVAKEHDVQNTFEEIEKNLGPVNFLVNTAGINRLVPNLSTFLICHFFLCAFDYYELLS